MGFPACDKCLSLIFFDPHDQLWHCDKCKQKFREPPAIRDEDIVVRMKHDDEPDEKWL